MSVPNASWTAVPWRVADFETVETWTSGSNPDRLCAAGGGYYLVTFKTWWTAPPRYYAAKVMLNGATNLHTDKRAAGPDDALLGSRAGAPERHHGLLDIVPRLPDIRPGA